MPLSCKDVGDILVSAIRKEGQPISLTRAHEQVLAVSQANGRPALELRDVIARVRALNDAPHPRLDLWKDNLRPGTVFVAIPEARPHLWLEKGAEWVMRGTQGFAYADDIAPS